MHWAPRRGYLEHSTGQPFSNEDIGRMLGMPRSVIDKTLYEMEHKYGTFSRDEMGVIFNRRMVRDTDISLKRKVAGSRGGNPKLLNQSQDLLNQDSNQTATKSPDPRAGALGAPGSSSFSSSAKASVDRVERTPDNCASIDAPVFALIPATAQNGNGHRPEWFDQWWAIYWRKVSRKPAEKAFHAHVKTEPRFHQVMEATVAQTPAMMARDPDHRPHGATWLNAERWNDQPSVPARASPGSDRGFVASVQRVIGERMAKDGKPW